MEIFYNLGYKASAYILGFVNWALDPREAFHPAKRVNIYGPVSGSIPLGGGSTEWGGAGLDSPVGLPALNASGGAVGTKLETRAARRQPSRQSESTGVFLLLRLLSETRRVFIVKKTIKLPPPHSKTTLPVRSGRGEKPSCPSSGVSEQTPTGAGHGCRQRPRFWENFLSRGSGTDSDLQTIVIFSARHRSPDAATTRTLRSRACARRGGGLPASPLC